MIYCIADLHGDYIRYDTILKMINFSDNDTLYVLGDVVDRGSDSCKILLDMMQRPNIIPILGNHEYMAMQTLKWLKNDITEENLSKLSNDRLTGLNEWLNVGGMTTLDEFRKLTKDEQEMVLEYLEEFSLYEEVSVGGKDFVLVHAGLDNFSPDKNLDDYQLHELIFNKPDYSKKYFEDKYLVTGHTPTRFIHEEINGYSRNIIFVNNNHIAIDCGCGHDGLLGAICLDTFEDFYC